MNRILRDTLFFLFSLLGVIVVLFFIIAGNQEKADLNDVTKKLEAFLQENYLDYLLKQETVVELKELEAINSLVFDAFKNVKKDMLVPKVLVIDSPVVNAFAVSPDIVIFTTGFFDFCQSPGEYVGVLAHELGHLEKKHTIKLLVANLSVEAISAMISSGNSSSVSYILNDLASLKFSRKMEEEADDYAFELMVDIGLDPIVFVKFFDRFIKEYGDLDKFSFLSSHPSGKDRRNKALVESLRIDSDEKKEFAVDAALWEELKKHVNKNG